MKAGQINSLSPTLPVGVTAYGRLALMLAVNCPIKAQVGCKNCTGKVYDRTGREFPVKCSKAMGYVEILNSDILCISDKLSDFGAADFLQLEFYDESPERAAKIVRLFERREPYPFGKTVTRGLYYRGVK
jgi:putative protease